MDNAIPHELIRTKADEIAAAKGYYYDDTLPSKIINFLNTQIIQSKAPFYSKRLELLPYQVNEIIRPLYGWKTPQGRQRHTRAIIFTPKKVGKTTLQAALAIYHTMAQQGAEVYCIASDVSQGKVLFDQAADFIELNPKLRNLFKIRKSKDLIECPSRRSKLVVLSSTPEGKSGINPTYVIWDEIAEFNATHAQLVYDRLIYGGAVRKDPIFVTISTAQFEREHLGFKLFCEARDLIEGSNTDDLHTLPVVYSLKDDEDWTDENNWWRVCPAIDKTVSKDFYRKEYSEAKGNPIKEAAFRTLLLCQWCGHGEQFISSHHWQGCFENFDEEELHGLPAYIGVDLSRRHDLSAYTILVPKDDLIYLLPRFYIPQKHAAKKIKSDRVPYDIWEQSGMITMTSGDVIDFSQIREDIIRDAERYDVQEIRFDPYSAQETITLLEEEGFYCVEVKQSYELMGPATAAFERYCIDGKFRHANNPVANWCLMNTTIRKNNSDQIMPDKRRSHGRIDFTSATCIGLSGIIANEGAWDLMLPVLL